MLGYCWPIVFDAGPTLTQHWTNVSCLLGSGMARVKQPMTLPDQSESNREVLQKNATLCILSVIVHTRDRGGHFKKGISINHSRRYLVNDDIWPRDKEPSPRLFSRRMQIAEESIFRSQRQRPCNNVMLIAIQSQKAVSEGGLSTAFWLWTSPHTRIGRIIICAKRGR